jgi:ABC-type transport system involved in multi-copper enzyme maturation permease subunit
VIASFRSEWFRLRRRPAVWLLAAALLAILLLFTYLLVWAVLTNPPRGLVVAGGTPGALKRILYPADWPHTVLGDTTGLGGAIAMIAGVLVAGSEYGWGTVKTILTQGPGRLRILAGKAAAMELLIAILAAAMLGVGAAASAILVTADSRTSAWPSAGLVLEAFGVAWLILSMYAGLGFTLGLLFRQTGVALGVGLVYALVVEGLVLNLLGGADAFKPIVSAFPGANAGGLVRWFPSTGPRAAAQPLMGAGQASIVLAAYIVLFAVVSALVFRARDVD